MTIRDYSGICLMSHSGLEAQICRDFVAGCPDESTMTRWLQRKDYPDVLLVAEGFEERSVGVIERLAAHEVQVSQVVIGRYVRDDTLNAKYRERFERAAEAIAPGRWRVLSNENDGTWVQEALRKSEGDRILLDISGVSNRAILSALNAVAAHDSPAEVAYTEAKEYWPKAEEWNKLVSGLDDADRLAEIVEVQPWIVGQEHHVVSVEGFEGYDSAGSSKALIGFLPYKRSRLAAIIKAEGYREVVFIAGKPRLKRNSGRLEILSKINKPIVGDASVIELPTFGYRRVLGALAALLFDDPGLHYRYDVHVAVLGSKLQTLACWYLARIVPSLAVRGSVPKQYYNKAFSEDMGRSWVVPLIDIGRYVREWRGKSLQEMRR